MIWPGAASAFTSGPPTISDSLLASARVRPAVSAARVGARPMEPVMPLRTVWQSEPHELGGRVGSGEDLGERLGTVLLGQRLAQCGHRVRPGDRDRADPQPARLLGQERDPSARRGERGDAEPVGVAQHQVDGLGADGPGGAEDDDVPAAFGGVEGDVRVGEGAGLSLMPPFLPHRLCAG